MATKRAALGFRVHTGWAALVAAAGPASSPAILRRERVEMIAGHDPGAPPFVYHAAAKLAPAAAARLVRDAQAQARQGARAALATAIAELRQAGCDVVACGIIVGNRAVPSQLAAILAAHPLMHAAEGELFRQAIASASEACGVPVTPVPAGELYARGARALGAAPGSVAARLVAVGRDAGRPWAQDQKESLLVALVALAGTRRS